MLFNYSRRSRALLIYPLPDSSAFEVSVSPDGRLLSYFTSDCAGVYGVLRPFPTGAIAARTPSYAIGGTDMTIAGTNWLRNDSVALIVQPDSLSGSRWVRHRRAIGGAARVVDTITP